MGSLKMPDHLKAELSSEAFGILLEGSPEENAHRIMEFIAIKKSPKIVIVGDFTLKTLLKAGLVPDLGIFDRRTKRIPCDFPQVETESVRNPAGEITDEATTSIKRALARRGHRKVMMAVDGEEDLLTLPAIIQAPVGSMVIYGLPNRGMMLVIADGPTKKKIAAVINQFHKEG